MPQRELVWRAFCFGLILLATRTLLAQMHQTSGSKEPYAAGANPGQMPEAPVPPSQSPCNVARCAQKIGPAFDALFDVSSDVMGVLRNRRSSFDFKDELIHGSKATRKLADSIDEFRSLQEIKIATHFSFDRRGEARPAPRKPLRYRHLARNPQALRELCEGAWLREGRSYFRFSLRITLELMPGKIRKLASKHMLHEGRYANPVETSAMIQRLQGLATSFERVKSDSDVQACMKDR